MKIDPQAREFLADFLQDYDNGMVRIAKIATGGG